LAPESSIVIAVDDASRDATRTNLGRPCVSIWDLAGVV